MVTVKEFFPTLWGGISGLFDWWLGLDWIVGLVILPLGIIVIVALLWIMTHIIWMNNEYGGMK